MDGACSKQNFHGKSEGIQQLGISNEDERVMLNEYKKQLPEIIWPGFVLGLSSMAGSIEQDNEFSVSTEPGNNLSR
jgi:hypothetical protein